MKQYISKGRAIYEDENHGLFSKELAAWAIGQMTVKDPVTKEMKPIKERSIEDVKKVLEDNKVEMPSEFLYTCWYLFNMAVADYPKTLTTDQLRATYVEETINDPDGCPESVLECFETKMCLMGIPIYWENYL